jgi:hypothetical protein
MPFFCDDISRGKCFFKTMRSCVLKEVCVIKRILFYLVFFYYKREFLNINNASMYIYFFRVCVIKDRCLVLCKGNKYRYRITGTGTGTGR